MTIAKADTDHFSFDIISKFETISRRCKHLLRVDFHFSSPNSPKRKQRFKFRAKEDLRPRTWRFLISNFNVMLKTKSTFSGEKVQIFETPLSNLENVDV